MSYGRSKKPYNYRGSKKGIVRCPYCETKKHIVVWEESKGRWINCWSTLYKDCRYKCTIFCWSAYGAPGCGRFITKYAKTRKNARNLCVQAWNGPYGEI